MPWQWPIAAEKHPQGTECTSHAERHRHVGLRMQGSICPLLVLPRRKRMAASTPIKTDISCFLQAFGEPIESCRPCVEVSSCKIQNRGYGGFGKAHSASRRQAICPHRTSPSFWSTVVAGDAAREQEGKDVMLC